MKKFIALLMAFTMVFALCACGKSASGSSSNTLVVGTSADYAPYEFMYKDDSGEMVYGGFDIDVAKFVADEMKKDMQIENMNFDYLLAALGKGDYDIVIACMESTDERLQAADFSDPYYQDVAAKIVIKAEDAEKYKTFDDFAGANLGVQTGTTKIGQAEEYMPDANLTTLVNVQDLINELVYGKLDAVLLDGSVGLNYANTNDALTISVASDGIENGQPLRIAVQKGDPKGLLPAINAAIAKITEDQINEWFTAANALADSGEIEEVTVDMPS